MQTKTLSLSSGSAGGDKIIGFQLCYEANGKVKALTWQEHDGFLHSRIDDGEGRPGYYKATPILIPDGTFDKEKIGKRFAKSSGTLPHEIADLVQCNIAGYNTLKK